MDALEIAVLGLVGIAAGAANTIAGGGTFISYPALIALGFPPITANVTSAVGLLSGYLGGSVSYRRELRGQGWRVRQIAPTVVLGAVAGAVLQLLTPGATFSAIVPYLVLLACTLLMVQPRMKALVQQRNERNGTDQSEQLGPGVHIGILLAAIYHSVGDIYVFGNSFRLFRFGEAYTEAEAPQPVRATFAAPKPAPAPQAAAAAAG
jgi:uncharacterized membrane protein YfcA